MKVFTPLLENIAAYLIAGTQILLSGVVYTARDAAHKRLIELIEAGKELPFDIEGQIIYYTGPSPAPPGKVIGAVGPTTSYRMDDLTEPLLKCGMKGTIGKGQRSDKVKSLIQEYNAPYFVATGGCGALLSKCVREAQIVAYEDLGAEAIHRLVLDNFPLTVANDASGGDIFKEYLNYVR